MKRLILAFSIFLTAGAFSQVDKKILNWYNGKLPGMETEKAYKKLKGVEGSAVVVAVIDSGVDIEHEDLKGSIWVNEKEIPNNGKDDDNNGYVDDINGWSFLCNADGDDLNEENLEMVRIYRKLHPKFEGKTESDIADADKADWALYQEVSEKINKQVDKFNGYKKGYEQLQTMLPMLMKTLNEKLGENFTVKDAEKWKIDEKNPMDKQMKDLAISIAAGELSEESVKKTMEYFDMTLNYHYNVDFDGRNVVGDNPDDFSDVKYGCNRVEGPDAGHGTHVSGIICATRGNGIGNDGVADNVKIMALRAVPNGDERDKDIALAIRYAVDNGAKIINMSFGKAYSPNSQEVFEAMKYACDNDVLLVHAAGNDHKDIDTEPNYPKAKYEAGDLPLLLTIGASTRFLKGKDGKGLAASFSNYGKEGVDIFAPGFEIYSTVPNDKYEKQQGTSMAAPMVSGVAALLKSYFPNLTMKQIKDIMIETGSDYNSVICPLPGQDKDGEFGKLSSSGKVVNVYQAVLKAQEIK